MTIREGLSFAAGVALLLGAVAAERALPDTASAWTLPLMASLCAGALVAMHSKVGATPRAAVAVLLAAALALLFLQAPPLALGSLADVRSIPLRALVATGIAASLLAVRARSSGNDRVGSG